MRDGKNSAGVFHGILGIILQRLCGPNIEVLCGDKRIAGDCDQQEIKKNQNLRRELQRRVGPSGVKYSSVVPIQERMVCSGSIQNR